MLFINNNKDIEEPNITDLLSSYSSEIKTDIINIIKDYIKVDDNCMILLPYDIELYNKENKDFIYIREFLLKTCNVKDIIYLPLGICNINIKLCILYFIKKRDEKFIFTKNKITNIHQTQNINFYDYNAFNNSKQLLLTVPINKIKNNKYSFNYIDYIQEAKISFNDTLIYKTIDEIALIQYGNKNKNKNGKYKIYGNKNKNEKSDIYNREGFNIIITKYEVALINENIFLNNYGLSIKPKSDLILHKYLGYFLFYNYKDINIKTLKSFEISIPSLEIQEEIIKYLDNIHNTISHLEDEIKELNDQSLYFMKKI
jgi:hypothetical protein